MYSLKHLQQLKKNHWQKATWSLNNLLFKQKFTLQQQLQYLKHMYFLLDNGYSFTQSLQKMNWEPTYENINFILVRSLQEGKPLDKAFERANFHYSIVSYFHFAHQYENILDILKNCLNMFEHRVQFIEQFRKTVRYPLFLLSILFILLLCLKTYIFPLFLQMFENSSSSSRTLLFSATIIELLTSFILILILLIIVLFLVWKRLKYYISIETQHEIVQKIPIYRNVMRLYTTYYFVSFFAMYLKAKLPMKEIVQRLYQNKQIPIISYYGEQIMYALEAGIAIDEAVDQLMLIDQHAKAIFYRSVNEESFEKDLSIYTIYLENKIKESIMKAIQSIQPVIFSLVAIFIVFIYFTLMVPMYQLIETI